MAYLVLPNDVGDVVYKTKDRPRIVFGLIFSVLPIPSLVVGSSFISF